MKDDKTQKIINSALKQFSKYGYRKTSIDSIVEDAGVSKGLLFYHFKSKKELYIYLVKYVVKIYTETVTREFNRNTTDFIEMLRFSTKIKLALAVKHPYTIDFYIKVTGDDVKFEEIEEFLKVAQDVNSYELYAHILKNTDVSKFKNGIDTATAMKVATWVAKGFFEEGKLNTLEDIEKNLLEYEDLLIKLLYKESCHG